MGLLMQVRVNWAFQKDQREDTSEHSNIFVGDLSNDINDLALFEAFQHCEQCSDARVMWDHATNRYMSLNSHAACGESCFRFLLHQYCSKFKLAHLQTKCTCLSAQFLYRHVALGFDMWLWVLLLMRSYLIEVYAWLSVL